MPVKQINTELGHSLPPEAPHNITFHIPGWDTAKALRRGDTELLGKLTSIYPRFGPWGKVRELTTALHPHLHLPPTHALILFPHPDTIPAAARYAASHHRTNPAHRIPPSQLLFRALDIPLTLPLASEPEPETHDTTHHGAVVRLYAVAYPVANAPGAVGVWQTYGTGISSRLAEGLLPAVGEGRVRVVEWEGDGERWGDVPGLETTGGKGEGGLPMGEGHVGLRRRIAQLVGGGGVVGEGDVWLYPTGMAAIYRLHLALVEAREGGTVVVLGSVFHNTYHLFLENEGGMKHFGQCDADSGVMEALEAWLEGEKVAGRKVGYIFAEFPSNPILVSLDLRRLRQIVDKYGVPVVIDDTIGSFCNIDVSSVADVIMTSTTKSLSGYANVMGGAITLPPTSPHYHPLKAQLTSHFRNEYFHADAAKLLSNSHDYFPRSAILNRNAMTLASFLHQHSTATQPATAAITAKGKGKAKASRRATAA
ncbi:hypothetical protein CHGG_01081 [Chaetomium globosum CBS 148.51]|uniref:Cystathionine gamma-synthase n=1 Tax=Chaetomium globosum (strain ATCC 6205 / CBS 148.51 / DSM 1962 / NBRC 6347 / NRRL 1970) TaxID=306901 RepID=Q2HFC3_CHAGB|nr:uncharacterized protein CHGG_01081 [Chaetomium globosum CBS 148.51]EAQ92846.1 hypothetical protein CHGG_01081 [Chaetomium globosum CBS 148.51]